MVGDSSQSSNWFWGVEGAGQIVLIAAGERVEGRFAHFGFKTYSKKLSIRLNMRVLILHCYHCQCIRGTKAKDLIRGKKKGVVGVVLKRRSVLSAFLPLSSYFALTRICHIR